MSSASQDMLVFGLGQCIQGVGEGNLRLAVLPSIRTTIPWG
jgi:hypothetical protein